MPMLLVHHGYDDSDPNAQVLQKKTSMLTQNSSSGTLECINHNPLDHHLGQNELSNEKNTDGLGYFSWMKPYPVI